MVVRDIVLIALFAALMAILALFPPFPVPLVPAPITAQTLGVMLAGSVLGAKRGFLSIALFLLLVALGLPLLAGGKGGIGVFAGPTGGFILGFPFGALVVGMLVEIWQNRLSFLRLLLANGVGGIAVVYLFGIPWLAVVAKIPFEKALLGSAIFIPGDAIKVLIAVLIAGKLRKLYPITGPGREPERH